MVDRSASNCMNTAVRGEPAERPWVPMPRPPRVAPLCPSAPTRYPACTVRCEPVRRSRSTAVTPSPSCRKDSRAVRNSIVAPSSVARPARIASARSWLTSPEGSGENAAKSGSAWVKLCSTGPDALCATTTAVSGRPGGAAARKRSATPAARSASIVAGIWPRALGCVDRPGCRSATSEGRPCRPRNMAVDRPARPAPVISTGMSAAVVVIVIPPSFARLFLEVGNLEESNYSKATAPGGSMSRDHRAALIAALTDQMRDSATRAVMVHQAIAERFGLNSTDLKCLDLARNERQLTAGRLAELTGMSTSAITTVLDRLERAGVIERTADPADRRKVIVTPTHRHEEARAAVFAELGERFGAVLGDYDDRELELMTDFLRRLNAVSYTLTRSLPGRGDADA